MPAFSWSSNFLLSATLVSLGDLENHFACLARFDRGDRGIHFRHWKSMRYHRRWIEPARSQEARHLNPGLVHPAPDDTVNRESLEDYFSRDIDLDWFCWNAEHLNASPDSHKRERLVDCSRDAGHLEHDVRAQSVRCVANFFLHLIRSDSVVRAHLSGEIESLVINIRCNDSRRTRGSADSGGEYSNRSAAGDENHRARNISGERRVKRVAHRIVNAADVVADRIGQMPHVSCRHRDVF